MPRLVISIDDQPVADVALTQPRYSIGRRASNDIVLRDDTAVSGEHAEVVISAAGATLRDCNSTNGTRVNDDAIDAHDLQHNDRIGIGRHVLRFVDDEAADATMVVSLSEDLGDLGWVDSSAPAETGAVTTAATAVAADDAIAEAAGEPVPAPADEPVVPSAPTAMELAASEPLPPAQLEGDDPAAPALPLKRNLTAVGRADQQLLAVARRPGGYTALPIFQRDGSGITVNGQSLSASGQVLQAGDVLRVDGREYRFAYEAAD